MEGRLPRRTVNGPTLRWIPRCAGFHAALDSTLRWISDLRFEIPDLENNFSCRPRHASLDNRMDFLTQFFWFKDIDA